MNYPLLFQVIKTVSLGAFLFGCRMNCGGRWGAAVTFWVVVVIDVIYYWISYFMMAVIDEVDCNQEYNATYDRDSLVTDCDEFKKQF